MKSEQRAKFLDATKGFEPICMNDSFSVVMFELNFDICFTFEASNFVRPRPFWGQFLIFAPKTVFIKQNELMHLKIVGFNSGVELQAGCIRSVFIVLARNLLSK
jgi:hypothetical protein